jgi:guanylate kinase
MLVAQWLDKAQKNMKPGVIDSEQSRSEAVYAEYANEPGFFDFIIVNDNLESAYERLKQFVMQYYWQKYDDEEGDSPEELE